jgi:prefoldin subunit 5
MKNNTNNKTLKDEIIGALDGHFQSFKVELKDELIVEVDKRFQSVDEHFQDIDGRFESIDKRLDKMDSRFEGMDKRFESLEKTVDEGFRGQGVLMEEIQDDIETLVEGQEILHARVDRVQGAISRVEAKVEDIDARLIGVEIA